MRRKVFGYAVSWYFKVIGVIDDLASQLSAALLDGIHPHSLWKVLSDVLEGNGENTRLTVAIESRIRLIFQVAIRIIVDGGDNSGVGLSRRVIGRCRKVLSVAL
jgi:hypothetical protein